MATCENIKSIHKNPEEFLENLEKYINIISNHLDPRNYELNFYFKNSPIIYIKNIEDNAQKKKDILELSDIHHMYVHYPKISFNDGNFCIIADISQMLASNRISVDIKFSLNGQPFIFYTRASDETILNYIEWIINSSFNIIKYSFDLENLIKGQFFGSTKEINQLFPFNTLKKCIKFYNNPEQPYNKKVESYDFQEIIKTVYQMNINQKLVINNSKLPFLINLKKIYTHMVQRYRYIQW